MSYRYPIELIMEVQIEGVERGKRDFIKRRDELLEMMEQDSVPLYSVHRLARDIHLEASAVYNKAFTVMCFAESIELSKYQETAERLKEEANQFVGEAIDLSYDLRRYELKKIRAER